MKLIAKILLCCILLSLASGFHVLRHFDKDIVNIKQHLKEGHTSGVFSLLMKMLVHTRTLYQEMKIPLPEVSPPSENANCINMLEELAGMFHSPNWI